MIRELIAVFLLSWLPIVAFGTTFTILGDDDFPPFSFTDQNNQLKGIDVEMAQEMAKRLGIKAEITLVPWKRLLHLTKQGDVFGSFSLFRTPEREAFALYTYPIHYSTHKLFTRKGNDIKFDALKDLYGKRVGIEAGFAISNEFDAARAKGDIDVVEFFNFEDAFRRILRGGIDAFVGNELVIKYKIAGRYSKVKNISDITSLPKPVKESRSAFFVLSKKFPLENKAKWQATIIEIFKQMEEDGFTDRVIQKYTLNQ